MDLLMDGLLTTATLFAGGYCWVLARRVRDLKSLDKGLGGAIVTLTRQVELARTTLEEAQNSTKERRNELGQLIARADAAVDELKLAVATARHAAPRPQPTPQPTPAPAPPPAPATAQDREEAAEDREEANPPIPFRPAAEAAENAAPREERPKAPDLPKPRALPPIGNPLRKREPIRPIQSEDELMDALTALAAGGAR